MVFVGVLLSRGGTIGRAIRSIFSGVLHSKVERSELMTGERSDQLTGRAAFEVEYG